MKKLPSDESKPRIYSKSGLDQICEFSINSSYSKSKQSKKEDTHVTENPDPLNEILNQNLKDETNIENTYQNTL